MCKISIYLFLAIYLFAIICFYFCKYKTGDIVGHSIFESAIFYYLIITLPAVSYLLYLILKYGDKTGAIMIMILFGTFIVIVQQEEIEKYYYKLIDKKRINKLIDEYEINWHKDIYSDKEYIYIKIKDYSSNYKKVKHTQNKLLNEGKTVLRKYFDETMRMKKF